jgi:hypothetical protein
MPSHYDLPKSKGGAIGSVLKRILQILKNKSKSDRRVEEDRRVSDDKYIGEMPSLWKTAKQRKVMDHVRPKDPSVTASDLLRNPGKPARRRGDNRRENPTARAVTRGGAILGGVGVPVGVAAGALQRNKNKKTTEQKRTKKASPTFDEQLEAISKKDYKLKRVQ